MPLAGHGLRPTPLRRRTGRPQLKRDPLGSGFSAMAFTVATYNVLASAYIKPQWYPNTPNELLRPEHRIPALSQYARQLDADILCLQEVEDTTFGNLGAALAGCGYRGALKKGQARPDGCAVFVRNYPSKTRLLPLVFHDAPDGQHPSGHVAQILMLPIEGHTLGLINTHLKWDPPNTPTTEQFGYRQVLELLRVHRTLAPECSGWIICGDFNTTPHSDVVAALTAAGFESAHPLFSPAATCNANRVAKMIDYLFHDAALHAEALPLPDVGNETALPGPHEPSDHVAVVARFEWRTNPSRTAAA